MEAVGDQRERVREVSEGYLGDYKTEVENRRDRESRAKAPWGGAMRALMAVAIVGHGEDLPPPLLVFKCAMIRRRSKRGSSSSAAPM
jgi:hypothetical protein